MLGGLGGIISSALGSVGLGGAASGAGAAAGLGLGPIAAALGMEALNAGLTERSNSMQRKHEWAMWNAQNEYNKPINQMARLREAGLNPNLVYGNGATTLAAPFHSSANQAAKVDVMSQLNAMNTLKQQDAMTQQIEAQKDHIKAQTGQISTSNSLVRAQTKEAQYRAWIAQHNYNLIKDTNYIMGEGWLQHLHRTVSGIQWNDPYDPGFVPPMFRPRRKDPVWRDKNGKTHILHGTGRLVRESDFEA